MNCEAPLISVIVPVYNTELYLNECIDSVFSQPVQDIELILIDDGSSDDSVLIAQAACAMNHRIKLLQQENSGPGAARNYGMSHAKGKYLYFVDSDDLVPVKGLTMLLESAERHNSEITCGIPESFNSKRKWVLPAFALFQGLSIYNITLSAFPKLQLQVGAWGKLYRRDFVEASGFRFIEKCNWGEDAYFVLNVLRLANRITLIPDITYRYRARENDDSSLTTQIRPQLFIDMQRVSSSLNVDFAEIDSSDMRSVREIHFLRSMRYHLSRMVKSKSDPDNLQIALNACQRILLDVRAESVAVFEPISQLAFNLLRTGEFAEGVEALASQPNVGLLKRVLQLPVAQTDIHTLRAIAGVGISLATTKKTEAKSSPITNATKASVAQAKISRADRRKLIWRVKVGIARMVSGVFRVIQPEIWLVGERGGDSIQDTGRQFFCWAHENRKGKNVWFVTKEKNICQMPAQFTEKILKYGSLKHFIYLFSARVLIYNDSHKDVFYHWKRLVETNKLPKPKKHIFLQHGIIATSRIHGYYNYAAMIERHQPADMFVVSSRQEKEFVSKEMGHPVNNVVVTGLSRYDKLPVPSEALTQAQPVILFIPTWRNWLRWNTDAAFLGSRFYKEIFNWLQSSELQDLLEHTGAKMEILMHHAFSQFAQHFKDVTTANITLTDMNACNVQEKLISAGMLITDYSSIGFDFAYMEKPVIYFQFDREEFLAAKGGTFIDLTKDLPGPVVRTSQRLETEIKNIIADGWRMSESSKERASKFFDYRDQHNSSRIFSAIERKLAEHDPM